MKTTGFEDKAVNGWHRNEDGGWTLYTSGYEEGTVKQIILGGGCAWVAQPNRKGCAARTFRGKTNAQAWVNSIVSSEGC